MRSKTAPYADKGDDAKAEIDDRVTIDFVGNIEGVPFEGGTAEDVELSFGSGSFIPGFEEQLKGAKRRRRTTVSVTFPDDYPSANLAGKFAEFDVTVKEVDAASTPKCDETTGAKARPREPRQAARAVREAQLAADFGRASRRI